MTNPVLETIRARRSIRAYEKKAVPQELIDTLIEAAQLAPTGMGKQPWHFTVVRDRAVLEEINEAQRRLMRASGVAAEIKMADDPGFDCFRGAPVVIFVSGDLACKFHTADCANAVTIMTLAAESLGLGTCYLAGFLRALTGPDGPELVKKLGLPEGYGLEFALSLGYKGEDPAPRVPRKENCVDYLG